MSPCSAKNSLVISFLWILSHIGLEATDTVDRLVKTPCAPTLSEVCVMPSLMSYELQKDNIFSSSYLHSASSKCWKGTQCFHPTLRTFFVMHTSVVVKEWWFVNTLLWVSVLGWGTSHCGRSLRQKICITTWLVKYVTIPTPTPFTINVWNASL